MVRDAEQELLADLERELDRRPDARIALLVGTDVSPLPRLIARAYPGTRIRRFDIRRPVEQLHLELVVAGRFDMIIDDSRRVKGRRALLRSLWFHLDAGGVYVVRDFRRKGWPKNRRPYDTALWPYLVQLINRRAEPADDTSTSRWVRNERSRAEALGRVTLGTEHLIMENRIAGYAKMHEHEMNAVIKKRSDDRAKLIMTKPAMTFESRAVLEPAHLYQTDRRFKRQFEVPELSVRHYRDVTLRRGGVALQGNVVLPETFRHNQVTLLGNRRLDGLTSNFATIPEREPPNRLSGRYLFLDIEWREHFGHFTTEQLPRLWAWPWLKEQMPDLKAILSLQGKRTKPKAWEIDLFSAAGIAPEDLVPFHDLTEVEELIGVTPMFSLPHYVHPEIEELWRRIGDRLAEQLPDGPEADRMDAERIFITRSPDNHLRECHNREQVEDRFRQHGFEIVRPELYSMAEQVRIFRNASVVAGFGGSGMFNLMFRTKPATVIVVRPRSYTSVNEYLISSITGNTVHMIDSVPDVDHPDGRWSRDAFHSGFSFDFEREGRDLDRVLSGL